MAAPVETGLTFADLERFPDDGLRRELIDGELYVSARPAYRHQWVMAEILTELRLYSRAHGGEAVTEPNNDYSERDHLEPDLVYLRPGHHDRVARLGVVGPPDVIVEISSPSTRSYDLIRKAGFYERVGVPEYWFVDLEHDHLEVRRLTGDRYQPPLVFGRGEVLTTPLLPGFKLDIDQILGPPEPRQTPRQD